jgi:hypothetical protein
MRRSNVDIELDARVEDRARTAPDHSTLLAAALAATLIEYRRCVHERCSSDGTNNAGNNWRMVACLERLRGRA